MSFQGDCGHLDREHHPCRAHGDPLQSVCTYQQIIIDVSKNLFNSFFKDVNHDYENFPDFFNPHAPDLYQVKYRTQNDGLWNPCSLLLCIPLTSRPPLLLAL